MAEQLGLSDAALATLPSVYAPGLFAGQTMLMSGGGGAIGRATAWLFARLGASVILSGRSPERIEAVAAAIVAAGYKACAIPADVRDPEAIARLFERIAAEQGGIDQLVNAAGGQFPQAAIDFSAKGWQAVIDTNLNGGWHLMQAAARHWRDAGRGGHIVNIVVVTSHGLYGVAHSVAARAGVIALSRSVAVEWAEHDIRVNCIAPGAIETEGWRVYSETARAAYPRSNPMKRAGTAWDIAEGCAYLASPAGRYITGELLTIDGGGQHWGETWTTGKPAYFND